VHWGIFWSKNIFNWIKNNEYHLSLGWNLPFPADGLLLSIWNVSIVDLLLSNNCYWMVFWCWKFLPMCGTNDWQKARTLLVSLLEILCTNCHDCKLMTIHFHNKNTLIWKWKYCFFLVSFCLLLYLLWASEIWKWLPLPQMGWNYWIVHQLLINDVGPSLCDLLSTLQARNHYGGILTHLFNKMVAVA